MLTDIASLERSAIRRPTRFGSDLVWYLAGGSRKEKRYGPSLLAAPSDEASPAAEPKQVLVVDDDPEHCAYMAEILTRRGYRSAMVLGGRAALRRLARESFDAVVTDVYMPDLDGIELVREVRQRWPALKIIAVTGGGGRHELPRGVVNFLKFLGISAILAKPFEPRDLAEAIRTALAD
jgi:two-component system, chemotaxis family, chemotaxis protein CheY